MVFPDETQGCSSSGALDIICDLIRSLQFGRAVIFPKSPFEQLERKLKWIGKLPSTLRRVDIENILWQITSVWNSCMSRNRYLISSLGTRWTKVVLLPFQKSWRNCFPPRHLHWRSSPNTHLPLERKTWHPRIQAAGLRQGFITS